MAELSRQATRRDLLTDGLRLGGLAVAGAGVLEAGEAFAQGQGDVEALEELARLELAATFTYAQGITHEALSPGLRKLAEFLHRQDREHSERMLTGLEALGARRPREPAAPRDVPGLARALAGRAEDYLEFAVALEERTVNAYYRAQSGLRDAKLLQAAATIMASDGQHLVVLRRALGREPVPHALETGAA